MKDRIYQKRVSLLLILAAVLWILWGNTALEISEYTVSSSEIPSAFSGFRIAHVSDYHNSNYWVKNEKDITLLKEAKPDIIVITGDLIDSNHTDMERALAFTEEAMKIAPVYYVTGNHEAWISGLDRLLTALESQGVKVLRNERITLTKDGDELDLIGLDDPNLFAYGNEENAISRVITSLKQDRYTILLSHRPEYFPVYADCGMDLTLSGHVHGGQFRLPLIGGLVGPDQGLFPSYDAGFFAIGPSEMIISRGMGNSVIPIRFHNRPEIPLIILEKITPG